METLAVLAFFATVFLVGFVLWRLILLKSYPNIGWRPLAFGYVLFVLAQLALLIILTGPVVGLYRFLLMLPFALGAATVIVVPIAAFMVRADVIGYGMVAVFAALDVFAAVVVAVATDLLVIVFPASSALVFGVMNDILRRERRLARAERTISSSL